MEALGVHVAEVGAAHTADDLVTENAGFDEFLTGALELLGECEADGVGNGRGVSVGFIMVINEVKTIALDSICECSVGCCNLLAVADDGSLFRAAELCRYIAGDFAGDDLAGTDHRGQNVEGQHLCLVNCILGQILKMGVDNYFRNLLC